MCGEPDLMDVQALAGQQLAEASKA
jgi:hypothetical protein